MLFANPPDNATTKTESDEKEVSVIQGIRDETPKEVQIAWMRISSSGKLGPVSDEIQDLTIGPSSALWVATNRGLSRLSDGKFRHFTRKNGLPHDQVFVVIPTARGVFAGTKDGLVWFDDLAPSEDIFPVLIEGTQGAVTSIFKHAGDILFLISPPYHNSQIGRLTLHPNGLPAKAPSITYPTNTRIRRLLPGSESWVFCQVPNRQWKQCQLPKEHENISEIILQEASILSPLDVEQFGQATLVLTKDQLLRQNRSGQFQPLPNLSDGDNTDGFLSLNRDGTGVWLRNKENLWLLNPVNGKQLLHLKLPSGVKAKVIAEEPNGRLWLGTENRGLLMSDIDKNIGWTVASTEFENYIKVSDSITDIFQSSEGIVGNFNTEKEASSILADFTIGGDILVKEEKGLLRLYEKNDVNDQNTWQLSNENVLNILGDNPTFIQTERNIYKLDNKEIIPFQVDSQMLEIRNRTISSGLLESTKGELESFKGEKITQWDSLAKKKSGEIVLRQRGPAYQLLANLKNEIIASPVYENTGTIFYSNRFNKQKDSVLNKLTHIPDFKFISVVVSAFREEKLFALNGGNILQVDKDFSVHHIIPQSDSNLFYNLTTFHDPIEDVENIFFLGAYSLWQKKKNSWERTLSSSKKIEILGLLPDNNGGGITVAGNNLIHDVFHLSEENVNRKITIYPATFRPENAAGGDNALMRDKKGNLWIGGKDLFVMEKGQQKLTAIPELRNQNINAILEYSSKILVSSQDGGLWSIEEGKPPYKISDLPGYTLAKFPTKQGGEELVWIGGKNTLAYLDKELTGKTNNYLEKSKIDLYIRDMESVENTLFVATDHGLVKLTHSGDELTVKQIILPLPGQSQKTVEDMTLLVKSNGQILVAAALGDYRSSLWQGSSENDQFKLVAEVDFNIDVLAETATKKILIGGNRPHIYTLHNNKLIPYRKVADYLPGFFRSMVVLNTSEFVILATREFSWEDNLSGPRFNLYHVKWDENTNALKVNQLDAESKPWGQHLRLSDSQVLLLHDNGTISLLKIGENPILQKIELAEKIHELHWFKEDKKNKKIYLLGNQHIWSYKTGSEAVKEISLPVTTIEKSTKEEPSSSIPEEKIDFSVDNKGVWLATPQDGLWRYDFKNPATVESWIPFNERDGLPSNKVEAVISLSDKEAVAFTQAGLCRVQKDHAGYWRFFPPQNTVGISGTEVRKASLFLLDDALTLALATDKGISLVRWLSNDWENQKWAYIDQDSLLLNNDITALRWHEATKELWLGSKAGLVVLQLITISDGSVKAEKPVFTLTEEQGLPAGKITAIRVSEDAKNAWILTENALTRLTRGKNGNRLVNSESFLFQYKKNAILGPSVNGQPSRVLIEDKNENWSVWNPAAYIHPQLTIKSYFFFWYYGQLKIESLNPSLEDIKLWDVEYRIDGIDQSPSKHSWGWLRDIWTDTGSHYMIARIKSRNNPSIEYRTTFPLPQAPSTLYRILRIGILFLVFLCMMIGLGWYFQKRRNQARRLREQEIPYIQGEAIQEPSQFFGRGDLLRKLQDSIPTTNYALVGKFRIGKTSIQLQLQNLLKSLASSKYVFLPIFLDLQLLKIPREKYFFHFLGEHLIQLAQEYKAPSNVLQELQYQQIESGEHYKHIHFKDDLEQVLDYLKEKFQEQTPVIVFQIDEILLMKDYDTLLKLRALLVREPQFKIVLSGKNIYKNHDRDEISPWWNVLKEIEVEPLRPSEAKKLIVDPVRGLFQFDEDAVELIIGRSQGMPLDIQTICADVLHYKYNCAKLTTRITEQDVYNSLDLSQYASRNKTAEEQT